jgi:hypothetical protein
VTTTSQSSRHNYTLYPALPPTPTYRGHKLVGLPGPQRWVLVDLLNRGGSPVGVTVGTDGGLGLMGEEEHGGVFGMLWWALSRTPAGHQ